MPVKNISNNNKAETKNRNNPINNVNIPDLRMRQTFAKKFYGLKSVQIYDKKYCENN